MLKPISAADVLAKPFYDQFSALQTSLGVGALVIIVVVIAVGFFATQYLREKASQLATRENISARIKEQTDALKPQKQVEIEHFEEATRQLAESTAVIKGIEKKFDFENWHMKEKNQLLRVKLEGAAFACTEAVSEVFNWAIAMRTGDGIQSSGHHGFDAMSSTLSLYFPELMEQGTTVQTTAMNFIHACDEIVAARRERIDITGCMARGVKDAATMLLFSRPTEIEVSSTLQVQEQLMTELAKFRRDTRNLMQSLLPN